MGEGGPSLGPSLEVGEGFRDSRAPGPNLEYLRGLLLRV